MKKIITIIIILGIIALTVYYLPMFGVRGNNGRGVKDAPQSEETYVYSSQPLDQQYVNSKYHFAFKLPTTFKASFHENIEGKDTLVISDASSTAGFQIDIQPIDEDIQALTVDRIKKDLPDILIDSPQDVILGTSGKGVAFMSDDAAFDGHSREVWFVYKKTLYQVRTFAKYDNLLKDVLGTWEFR